MNATYQVAIIGGGPAGTATALQLQRSGVQRVLLVEKGDYSQPKIGESLPPGTNVLLNQLGIWSAFAQEKHLPVYGSCSIWGAEAPGYNDYMLQKHGYGWHLDRSRFDAFLAQQAQLGGTALRTQTRLIQSERTAEGHLLQLENGQGQQYGINARFVVDATGPQAVFARKMGAQRQVHDRLVCVSAILDAPGELPTTALTYLEAVEYGWWYMAALPGQKIIAALATDPETIHHYRLTDPAHWQALLCHTRLVSAFFPNGLPTEPAQLEATPAFSSQLDTPNGADWLAVGDAASAYDPISSLGIYKSLSMGMYAGKAIAAQLAGNPEPLAQYAEVLATDFTMYLENRNYFYTQEKRWPSSWFWQRRAGRVIEFA